MRVEGWEALLYEHIHQAHTTAFAWGTNDCALWCSEWVRKATGKDFGADWRGFYTSADELTALLQARGYETASDVAQDNLRHIPLSFTQRGDIVLHPQGCLGICDGLVSYFLMVDGVTRLHTHHCRAAWKVE